MELQVKLTSKIDAIQQKLRECNYECNRLKEFIDQAMPHLLAPPPPEMPTVAPATPPPVSMDTPVREPEIIVPVPPVETPEVPIPPVAETPVPTPVVAPVLPPAVTPSRGPTPPPTPRDPVRPTAQPRPQKPKPAAAKSSRDLEEFIGGNLLNKIGIGILIIGIGIFVKYAIDQDWIGPVGRVLIGLGSGGILLGIAHRMRKTYKAFSSVLLGGGIAILYFTVAIAYHTYGLLGQTAAFGLMSVVTAATIFFSLAYDRMEIAILALVGGFAAPFMVSNGSGNYVTLFSYILVLNIGMMVLSWFRDWKPVRILSYAFTVLLVGGWLGLNLYNSNLSVLGGTLTFATVFFVVFFAMNIAFNVKAKKPLGALEFVMILSNSMLYFAAAMSILHYIDAGRYMGLFTAIMALFHFAFIFPVRRLLKLDRNLQLLLIGLVLTFITLAIPIQLEGSYITLFWAAETVILLVLAQRSGIGLLRTSSQIVSALAVLGLIWDWSLLYFEAMPSGRTLIANGAFVTTLVTAASMVALYWLYKRAGKKVAGGIDFSPLYQFIALPILYFGGLLELVDQTMGIGNYGLVTIAVVAYSAIFLCVMQIWAIRDKRKNFGDLVVGLSLLGFVLFAAAHFGIITEMRSDFVYKSLTGEGFGWHLMMVPGLFALLGLNVYHLSRHQDLRSDIGKIIVWGAAVVFLFLASVELDNLLVMAGIPLKTSHKVGYPILWGISAFAFILIGMRKQFFSLRIAGLALFCLILVKLFVYDIREVPTGGKIAAFISLGVLLLVISFMYQRLKKLLFEEEGESRDEE